MVSWTRLLAAAAASWAAAVSADTSGTGKIYSVTTISQDMVKAEMVLGVSFSGANSIPTTAYTVVPLTEMMGLNRSSIRSTLNIQGELVLATVSNYANISGSEIAFLSCDDMNSSFIDQNSVFNTLMDNAPTAILLYTEEGVACGLSGSDLSYQNILSMVTMTSTTAALNASDFATGTVYATISGNSTDDDSDSDTKTSNNSAIAMSILYSITGLITLLFLIIIATGAFRAHRHPERYGPRSGYNGRPRQSRVKGIARAVLDTIPIVKFGESMPVKPDPNTELESGPNIRTTHDGLGVNAAAANNQTDVQARNLSAVPDEGQAKSKAASEPAVNAGGAAVATEETTTAIGAANTAGSSAEDAGATVDDNHLGCSICTEDFTVGEDVRVLPCNHKFHPTCVDPWLINVSGTCPLCRLDLHPGASASTHRPSTDEADDLPPPLDADEASGVVAESAVTSHHHRRATRLFDLNRLRHAPIEERIEALRRYRTENQTAQGQEASSAAVDPADGEDERSRSAKLTKRLRDKFRIRTRVQSPGASSRDGSRAGSPAS